MNMAIRSLSGLQRRLGPTKPAVSRAGHLAALARIDIHDDLAAAQPIWQRLEDEGALVSPYQRYRWASIWQRHVGERQGAVPFVVVGSNSAGAPLFLWPFVRTQSGRLRVARFFGGKHANINVALWNRDFAKELAVADMRAILSQVAGASHGIDLFMLVNQPATWEGIANPFLLLSHQRASDDIYQLSLHGEPAGEVLKKRLNPSLRGRLRTKERKLQKLDGYRYVRAATAAEVDRHLDAFFVQKAAHLTAHGLADVFAEPGVEAFLRAACHDDVAAGRPLIEIHALEGAGEVLALFAGVADERRYSSMFNSYTLGENARHSPGLVLLTHMVANCADRRLSVFDLGVGEARYKRFFCKELLPLYDGYWPVTWRGRAAAGAARPVAALKRLIKSTPVMWNTIQAARRRLVGRSTDEA
jgi:CelD/BcsL family acetyltransferase involved in cellulose biosynthesis